MKTALIFLFSLLLVADLLGQKDAYDLARLHLNEGEIDSARYYINQSLARRPNAEDYFLSGMIFEAEGKGLRALADYEAVIQYDPDNLEAYFQKGLIYYNSASAEQAILDFTYIIENYSGSATNAVYYVRDPSGDKGTFLTTLQSLKGEVYQYRGLAYQKKGEWEKALQDFSKAFEYGTSVENYINRSQLYAKMGRNSEAISDLKAAVELDSTSYSAWYNLAILDETTVLPRSLMNESEFTPMLNLAGANAFESGDYELSVQYHTKAIEAAPKDDLAYLGRGKAFLRMEEYGRARQDFIKSMQLKPARTEAFYLIGNSFFYEKRFENAVGFYEQYLSLDQKYENVWFNAAMAYFNLDQPKKACVYLQNAEKLGMQQASELLEKHCGHQ